jgi:hypothetical protein
MLLSLAALALFAVSCGGADPRRDDPAGAASPSEPPAVMTARVVCRLIADNESAVAANALGADGVKSVVSGDRSYWFFGDTIRRGPEGRHDVIASSLATSTDGDASDCIDLEFATEAGSVASMLPPLDETTAWTNGVITLDDGSMVFYIVKAYRDSPFAWHVGAIGVGRLTPGETVAERLNEDVWGDDHGFDGRITGVRSPVRDGDDVIVYIRTEAGANYVARVPVDRMAERDAYRYWDGDGWSADASRAQRMWPDEKELLPVDNGVEVFRDELSGEWLAMYNRDLSALTVRSAPEPWGPWSDPVTWLDCRPLVVEDEWPFCYSARMQRQYTRDGGATLYVTFASQDPYDVTLLELRLGVPVHEWHGDDGRVRYAPAPPGEGYTDGGVAFHASLRPAPGLSPVYEREEAGAYVYSVASRVEGAELAFYVLGEPSAGAARSLPVYRAVSDDVELLSTDAEEGEVAFHAPCTRHLDRC